MLLFDAGAAPLAAFGPQLSARAAASLAGLGVEVHLGARVTDVDQDGLVVQDALGASVRYEARNVLWTAGVTAPPFADSLARATGAEQDHAGRIVVRPDLTISGHPEISVVGDMMSLDHLPGVAEVAMQSGHHVGTRLRQQIDAGSGPWRAAGPFRYRDLGSAAYLARGQAVVSVGRFRASGLLGWFAWLGIHLAFLTTFRNRAGAIVTWAISFSRGSRRERAFTMQQIVPTESVYDTPAPGRGRRDPDPPARGAAAPAVAVAALDLPARPGDPAGRPRDGAPPAAGTDPRE